jgi:hypothetical protein
MRQSRRRSQRRLRVAARPATRFGCARIPAPA